MIGSDFNNTFGMDFATMVASKKDDIMDALLKGTSEDLPEDLKTLKPLIHLKREKKTGVQKKLTRKTVPVIKTGTAPKKKTTHYLSEEIFADLDEAKEKINTLMQEQQKTRVSKSRIVNQALKMILKDFAEKGEKSTLIQEILKNARKG